MANRTISPVLKDEIRQAVKDASDDGQLVSKSDVARRFQNCGLARSTVYLWIDRFLLELAAGAVQVKRGGPAIPLTEVSREMISAGNIVDPVDGIPYIQIIQNNLNELRLGLAMAKDEDGRIKNVRLMLACVDGIGRQLSHAARVQVATAMDHNARNDKFLDQLVDLVMAELPHRRDEILAGMEALRLRYGS